MEVREKVAYFVPASKIAAGLETRRTVHSQSIGIEYYTSLRPLRFERETGCSLLLAFQALAQISKGLLFWQTMIGIFKTTNPNTGQGIVIRFTRIDNRVRINSICDASGMDIWGRFSSAEIQVFKADIAQLAR